MRLNIASKLTIASTIKISIIVISSLIIHDGSKTLKLINDDDSHVINLTIIITTIIKIMC